MLPRGTVIKLALCPTYSAVPCNKNIVVIVTQQYMGIVKTRKHVIDGK
jgi:hypothetical protein